MLLGFSILGCSEQDGVGTGWGGHDQLIESEALSTGFDNLSSGGLGESEGTNGKLWNSKESVVISDS